MPDPLFYGQPTGMDFGFAFDSPTGAPSADYQERMRQQREADYMAKMAAIAEEDKYRNLMMLMGMGQQMFGGTGRRGGIGGGGPSVGRDQLDKMRKDREKLQVDISSTRAKLADSPDDKELGSALRSKEQRLEELNLQLSAMAGGSPIEDFLAKELGIGPPGSRGAEDAATGGSGSITLGEDWEKGGGRGAGGATYRLRYGKETGDQFLREGTDWRADDQGSVRETVTPRTGSVSGGSEQPGQAGPASMPTLDPGTQMLAGLSESPVAESPEVLRAKLGALSGQKQAIGRDPWENLAMQFGLPQETYKDFMSGLTDEQKAALDLWLTFGAGGVNPESIRGLMALGKEGGKQALRLAREKIFTPENMDMLMGR